MAKEVKINPHTNLPIEEFPKWVVGKDGKRIIVNNEKEEAELAGNYGVKIHLVKSASDLKITYKLAKADMVKVVRGK